MANLKEPDKIMFRKKLATQYKGVRNSWEKYWVTYGGFRSLMASPYLHISIIITAVCKPIWMGAVNEQNWFDLCLTIIPSLLGFTLGGYAILLAVGDEKFRKKLAGPGDDGSPSPFMALNSTFLHFIVIQLMALFYGLISFIWEIKKGPMAFIGFNFFIYALTTSLGAAFAILHYANWYDIFAGIERKKEQDQNNKPDNNLDSH